MANTNTSIEWTDATWSPVTGCTKVSAGCKHCYAEGVAERFWGERKFTDVRCHPERLEAPLHWRKPRRVFVNSMSDLFHEDVQAEFIGRVFAVMALCPQHTFQILTKRPQRMADLFADGIVGPVRGWAEQIAWERTRDAGSNLPANQFRLSWPLPNVWLGVSAEDQATADERIPLLLETPAAVRFVSCEPLLGPIDVTVLQRSDGWQVDSLRGIYSHSCDEGFDHPAAYEEVPGGPHLDWLIVGGESGPNARPCDVAWIRSIVEQCGEAGLACFVKQLGAVPFVGDGKHTHVSGYRGYGVVCDQGDPCPHCGKHPITQWPSLVLRDRKGSDPSEWPDDLRVREFPR